MLKKYKSGIDIEETLELTVDRLEAQIDNSKSLEKELLRQVGFLHKCIGLLTLEVIFITVAQLL